MDERWPAVLLFVGSGCAALIYEIVWFHLLRLVIGGSSISLGIVLVSGIAAAVAVYAKQRGVGAGNHTAGRTEKITRPAATKPGPSSSWLPTAAPVAIAAVAVWLVAAPPHGFLAATLYPEYWNDSFAYPYLREGRQAPVAVQEHVASKQRSMWISGKIVASNAEVDMRTVRLLGHLPALVHGAPKSTLTVGLGTGTTAGCFVIYPTVEQMHICEIEPAVEDAARLWFAEENHHVLEDPRTTLTIDDARHFLATTDERFDVITSDPIHPWVRGAAALYSTEYYDLCKEHLNPHGIVVQWIPFYDADPATVKCQLATFVDAFPDTMFWTSWRGGSSNQLPMHDVVAVGSMEPIVVDLEDLDRRLHGDARLKADLDEVRLGTVGELFGQYVGRGEDLRPWLADAQINTDVSLRLEYLAGLWMWINVSEPIMREVHGYVRYPAEQLKNDQQFKDEITWRLGLSAAGE